MEVALTYVYGIGRTSRVLEAKLGVNPDTRVRNLTGGRGGPHPLYIDQSLRVEGDLRGTSPRTSSARSRSAAGRPPRKGLPVATPNDCTLRARRGTGNKKKAVRK